MYLGFGRIQLGLVVFIDTALFERRKWFLFGDWDIRFSHLLSSEDSVV